MKHLISEYFAYRKERQFQISFRKIIYIKEKLILTTGNLLGVTERIMDRLDMDLQKLVDAHKITNNEKREP